jgi:hypothetical protein
VIYRTCPHTRSIPIDVHLLLVPYDTGRRGWRSGAGPEHLLQAGLANHFRDNGHFVADIQVIEDDSACRAAFVAIDAILDGAA